MVDIVTSGNLDGLVASGSSLATSIAGLVSTSASATSFGFSSNSVGGAFTVNGTGQNFTFDKPYSSTPSLTRTLTGGTIDTLTFTTSYSLKFGGSTSASTTFNNLNLPVSAAFQPGYLNNILDGSDIIRLEIDDITTGPSQNIKSYSINAGSGDDVVIDEMTSSVVPNPVTPGNPFNKVNLGTGSDSIQISNNNRSFEITSGDGRDTIIINTGNPSGAAVRQVVITDFSVTQDTVKLSGQSVLGARLQDVAGGVQIVSAGGTVLAFIQNVTAAQLRISNGQVTGVPTVNNILGTEGDDVIHGSALDDTIQALGGNDLVIAGSGFDSVFGGAGSDVLVGGEGSDRLEGGAGNDFLRGDAGADQVFGGDGTDRADYTTSTRGVIADLTSGIGKGGDAEGDKFSSIENLYGSAFDDTLTGNYLANSIWGNAGNDQIYGLAGNDYLNGQNGNDIIIGGVGSDTLIGEAGDDVLRGDEDADIINGGDGFDRADYTTSNAGVNINLAAGTASGGHAAGDKLTGIESIYGSNHADVLTGSEAVNWLWGADGSDQIYALGGNDYVDGQNGDDAIFGGHGNDTLLGGAGLDGLFGEAGNDTVFGGDHNDYIEGGDGNDALFGDAGDDQILGGAGDDFVVLGAGSDTITLGSGADRVRFDYGNGADVIHDFGNGADVIDFSATNMTLAALQANSVDTASGVLMTLGSGSILLEGLTLSQLEWATDFAFAH
jgi:Ca2+-binding RTX toxin-like protein